MEENSAVGSPIGPIAGSTNGGVAGSRTWPVPPTTGRRVADAVGEPSVTDLFYTNIFLSEASWGRGCSEEKEAVVLRN